MTNTFNKIKKYGKNDRRSIGKAVSHVKQICLGRPYPAWLKEKDLAVLLMTDPIDERVIGDLAEFEKKSFRPVIPSSPLLF